MQLARANCSVERLQVHDDARAAFGCQKPPKGPLVSRAPQLFEWNARGWYVAPNVSARDVCDGTRVGDAGDAGAARVNAHRQAFAAATRFTTS